MLFESPEWYGVEPVPASLQDSPRLEAYIPEILELDMSDDGRQCCPMRGYSMHFGSKEQLAAHKLDEALTLKRTESTICLHRPVYPRFCKVHSLTSGYFHQLPHVWRDDESGDRFQCPYCLLSLNRSGSCLKHLDNHVEYARLLGQRLRSKLISHEYLAKYRKATS